MIDAPLFLVGAERSGSTLLRLMLDHHPEISFQGEFDFAVAYIGEDGRLPVPSEYREHLSMDRVFRHFDVEVDPSLDYRALVDSFLVQRRARSGKTIVGATVHHAFDRLIHIWPNARLIHLVRDGRDVAASRIAMGWHGNMWTAAQSWLDAETLWDAFQTHLPPEAHITVRYEDLVSDPVSQLKRICTFIRVDFNDAMLRIDDDTTYARPDQRHQSKWRHNLSPMQIRLGETRMRHMLLRRGYQLSGLPPIRCGLVLQALLDSQCWAYRSAFRMRRYGPRLTVLDAIGRRTGSKKWQRHVTERMHEITDRHLK